MAYLKKTLGDEQYYNEVLTYPSSINEPTMVGKNAIDFDNNTYWVAKSRSPIGEYIIFYFPNYYIKMSGYAIRTSKLKPSIGICHPKNWGFDASYDNKSWVHQVNYTDTYNKLNQSHVTEFVGWNYGTYKYFRFMITGEQHDQTHKNDIDLARIEFFGDLLRYREIPTRITIVRCHFNIMYLVISMISRF